MPAKKSIWPAKQQFRCLSLGSNHEASRARRSFACVSGVPMVFRTSALLSEHRTPSALGPKRHLGFSETETHPTGPRAHVRTCADDPSLVTQVWPHFSSSFHWSVVPQNQNPRVREKLEALVVLPLLGRAASRCAKRDDDSQGGASRCLVGQAHKPPAGPHHQ